MYTSFGYYNYIYTHIIIYNELFLWFYSNVYLMIYVVLLNKLSKK